MSDMFSDRHGFRAPEREITVREEAPDELRVALCPLARQAGMSFSEIRSVVCDTLLVRPDPSNWSEVPNIRDEVVYLVDTCEWFKIYDMAEALCAYLKTTWQYRDQCDRFSEKLNQIFREKGIGWEMDDHGKIQYRGSESFGHATKEAFTVLQDTGRSRAASEMAEAIADISRRPTPDITGAVQHAMAALEATARDVTGQRKPTLGQLVSTLKLKAPLDMAIKQLWGYASNEARHGIETSNLKALEAELIVGISGTLCTFLAKLHSRTE